MKRVVFPNEPRPHKYFEGQNVLDPIEEVTVPDVDSFPSGHTMTAFAIAVFLMLMIRNRYCSFALMIGAALVGVSRMFPSRHFLVDVLVGSLMGTIVTLVVYALFQKYLEEEKLVSE